MPTIDLSKETRTAQHGRYTARIKDLPAEAELTFTQRAPDLISADHTGAPESMRGTGAAAALVSFMVDDARRNGFKIIPLCPYVRAQYAKHPAWADVFTTRPGEAP